MRIALCLSGQPRTWRHTWRTVFDYFAPDDLDVFIHTWDETDPSELEDIRGAYAPKAMRAEPRPRLMEQKRRMAELFPVSPPFTILDMFHSVSSSIGLALEANDQDAPYDLICRSRFDIIHDGKWSGRPTPKACIALPSYKGGVELGCNDQFAIGDPDAMRRYAGVFSWLLDGMADLPRPRFKPEIALQHYLATVCGLTILREPMGLTLLRADQVARPFSDLRDDPMFHARKHEDWEAFAKTHQLCGSDGALIFEHYGRAPLAFDRWLEAQPAERRDAVLERDWPERIVAIDRLLGDELGRVAMDPERYGMLRMICAALAHRMARDEPLSPLSFIVHALSANHLDVRRARTWVEADSSRPAEVVAIMDHLPMLSAAMRFAPPFQQPAAMGWRVE